MGITKKDILKHSVAYIADMVFACIAIVLWFLAGLVIVQYMSGVEVRLVSSIPLLVFGTISFGYHLHMKAVKERVILRKAIALSCIWYHLHMKAVKERVFRDIQRKEFHAAAERRRIISRRREWK